MTDIDREWTVLVSKASSTALAPLLCFPYAGAISAAVFHPLTRRLSGVTLRAVQLPGRGARSAEAPARSVAELVRDLSAALVSTFDPRLVLYGHSFGAVVAFEVARHLQEHYDLTPGHLVVSGRRAPRSASAIRSRSALADDDLIADMVAVGAAPEPFEVEELRTIVLRALRTDLRLSEDWRYRPGRPLGCPVTAVAGTADGEAPPPQMEPWREETAAPFRLVVVDSDHFMLDHPGLATALAEAVSPGSSSR